MEEFDKVHFTNRLMIDVKYMAPVRINSKVKNFTFLT